jgi:uncharacterized protein GlcG (DUF336 family)
MEDILSLKNIEIQEFDFNDVTKLIESAVTHALSLKVNVSISIFDRYGREVGFYRMPQSPFSSDAVARGKAYAAFCFKTDTAVLEKKIPFEKMPEWKQLELLARNRTVVKTLQKVVEQNECEICGKVCKNKSGLKAHLRSHN